MTPTSKQPKALAHRFNPDKHEIELRRTDQPGEAQKFFMEQRAPQGATALDMQWYLQAEQHAAQLPWYSAARAQKMPATTPNSTLTELSAWQQLGPGNIGGRTRVLRFQPGNPNTMYVAGVNGGLWKSTDAGAHWNPMTDLAPNLAIVSMVIDPANPLHMWVGTGEGIFSGDSARGAGIFYSSDGGLNWNQLLSTAGPDFYYVNDLVQSPNTPATLYAATRNGTFRSLDSGASWTRVIDTTATGLNIFGGCFSIKALPTGPTDTVLSSCGTFGGNAAFTSIANGIVLRNTDAGGVGAWTSVLSVANQGRTTLAVAPSDSTILYALVAAGEQTGGTYDDGLLGVWKSIDSGANWAPQVQTISGDNRNNFLLLSNPVYGRLLSCGYGGSNQYINQGWYDNIITVDPVDPTRVWVGGIDLWRSDDSGANWGVASYWWFTNPDPNQAFDTPDPNYAHADNHGIVFHPGYNGTSNKMMYATSDGGIFRTEDATATVGTNASADPNQNSICGNANFPGLTWSSLNNGYAVTQFYDGAVYPDNSAYIAGAQDNGTDRGFNATGPNAWGQIQGGDGGYVAVDPTNSQNLYAEFTGISMTKSTDGGTTFADAVTGIADSGQFINPFIIDGNNPNRFWTGGIKLWRSDNAMGTWAQSTNLVLPGAGSRKFSAFAVAPALPNLMLAATNSGRVYQFTTATTDTPATPKDPTIYSLPRPGANGNYVSSLTFDPTQTSSDVSSRVVIVGSSTFNAGGAVPQEPHVLKSTNAGLTWTGIDGMTGTGPSPNGLPNVPVNSVLVDPTTANSQRIFVGTDIGVFVTTDGGASWARENTGFANTSVRKLIMQRNPTTGNWELFAFTHGRSVYKSVVLPGDFIFANGFD